MEVVPHNKRLLIRPSEETKEETLFYLPEDTKTSPEWTSAEVLSSTEEDRDLVGKTIIAPTHLIEKVTIGNREYSFIQSNYIVASYRE